MAEALVELAERFFGNLQYFPEAQKELKRYDRQIQFELTDDESFFVDVKGGKVSINRGITRIGAQGPIYFVTDRETLISLFRGKERFANLYEYRPGINPAEVKGRLYVRVTPMVASGMVGGVLIWWLGKLIRMGQELR